MDLLQCPLSQVALPDFCKLQLFGLQTKKQNIVNNTDPNSLENIETKADKLIETESK